MKNYRLSELADKFGFRFIGKDIAIDGLGLTNRDTEHVSLLSYVTSDKYVQQVKDNKSIACIVLTEKLLSSYSADAIGREISYVVSEKPETCFYSIHEYLCESGNFYPSYNFESQIGSGCKIANSAIIEKGVIIGSNVSIGPNTVVRSGSIIDNNTIIGCNTTIGSEGFQLITDGDNAPLHITHVGRCHICSNVYVGDNTCICNSLFEGETYIGDGAKIDNLVHVAHNLYIGKNAVITAHVILCGSSRIEEGAWIAPNSSVLNRVVIGKYSKVGLGSVVTRDVAPYTVVYGSPAKTHDKN